MKPGAAPFGCHRGKKRGALHANQLQNERRQQGRAAPGGVARARAYLAHAHLTDLAGRALDERALQRGLGRLGGLGDLRLDEPLPAPEVRPVLQPSERAARHTPAVNATSFLGSACRIASMPWCNVSSMPVTGGHVSTHWRHASPMPWRHASPMPWCHASPMPWCHASPMPWCQASPMPWRHASPMCGTRVHSGGGTSHARLRASAYTSLRRMATPRPMASRPVQSLVPVIRGHELSMLTGPLVVCLETGDLVLRKVPCVHACVHACVRACVHACVDVYERMCACRQACVRRRVGVRA